MTSDARALATRIAHGDLTAAQAMADTLSAIERLNPTLNAVSHVDTELGHRGAAAVDAALAACHHDETGQNITFIEAEEIEAFLNEHRRPYDLSVTHRNVVTRGVRLNELLGREFTVGGVRFRGVEFCEPWLGLGAALASSEQPAAAVVKCLVRRAGLRADALSDGELALGAKVGGVL
jgi:MOSC domain-containing protein YiiM